MWVPRPINENVGRASVLKSVARCETLFLRQRSVGTCLHNIKLKLGASDSAELAMLTMRSRIAHVGKPILSKDNSAFWAIISFTCCHGR